MTDSLPSESARTSARLHRRRRGWKSYAVSGALLFLVLVAGCVIGVAGTVLYFKHTRFAPPRPSEIGGRILARMFASVELTEAEKAEMTRLVNERMEAIGGIRRESFGRIREEFDGLNTEIDGVLGPERAEQWNEAVKKITGRDRRDHPGPGDKGSPDTRDARPSGRKGEK